MARRGASVIHLHPDTGCVPVACRDCGVYRLCVPLGLDQEEMSLLDHIVKRNQIIRRGQIMFGPSDISVGR